jgi:hypothetical protein
VNIGEMKLPSAKMLSLVLELGIKISNKLLGTSQWLATVFITTASITLKVRINFLI